MRNKTDGKFTRREIVRGVSMAAAGAAVLGKASMAQSTKKDDAPCCESQAVPKESVFTKVCNKDSALKYESGDNTVVYRLGAMWLMLATEDWTQFFRDPKDPNNERNFLEGLATDLKLNLFDVQKLWEIGKAKSTSFEDIRSAWQIVTSNEGLYGARPCHGGKSIMTIACLDPKDEGKQPMLNTKARFIDARCSCGVIPNQVR
jgi:hypothetical protein